MKTLKIPYTVEEFISEEFEKTLHELRRVQSSIYRFAFNRASEGLTEKEVEKECKEKFPSVDSWVIRSVVKRGVGQFKADWELAKLEGREFDGKRIFGGKKNFIRRVKGLITEEEWKEFRMSSFYSIGEENQKGNRKFAFNIDSIIFKPSRGIKFELNLPNLRGIYAKDYLNIVEATTNKAIPITVSIDKEFIYLSYDETKLETIKPKKIIDGRYLGVDLNPNYIGVSFFDEKKCLLDTKLYNFKELTGKNINPDKLKHELRQVAIDIGRLSQHYQIQYMFVEELKFKQGDKKKGKNFNRLTSNQFLINEFSRMLSKFGKVVKVNAGYSSTIGNIIHSEFPDPLAASMEIARRGIESRVVKGSNAFYPPLVSQEVLQRRWKDVIIPIVETWIELHNFLKTTGVKYRVPIPSGDGMFRPFNSVSSKVYVLV